MPFLKNNTYGVGRPRNSKNKLPDRNQICDLVDLIVSDFQGQYDKLTITEKIKILEVFKNLFASSVLSYEHFEPDNEIKITIINPQENV